MKFRSSCLHGKHFTTDSALPNPLSPFKMGLTYVAQASLEPQENFLFVFPWCWNYRRAPPCLARILAVKLMDYETLVPGWLCYQQSPELGVLRRGSSTNPIGAL